MAADCPSKSTMSFSFQITGTTNDPLDDCKEACTPRAGVPAGETLRTVTEVCARPERQVHAAVTASSGAPSRSSPRMSPDSAVGVYCRVVCSRSSKSALVDSQ